MRATMKKALLSIAVTLLLAPLAHGQAVISQAQLSGVVVGAGGGGGGPDIAVGITEVSSALNNTVVTTGAVTTGTTGSVILVACSASTGVSWAGSPVTDSKTNTWTEVGSEVSFTTDPRKHRLYQCTNCTGGTSHTFSCNATTNGTLEMFAVEFLNAATASAIDTSNQNADDASEYSVSVTTGTANTCIAAFVWSNSSSNPTTFNETGAFTEQDAITDGATLWPGQSATRCVTSTGTYTPSWTASGTSQSAVQAAAVKD
jgi:hypothetical protein